MSERGHDRLVKVSVHMPAYNHGRYIAQALDSVLMQDVDFDYEVVIGDDCSTDDTKSVALAYAGRFPERIRVLAHPTNVGIHENDRRVTQMCCGEYIAWLESDDYWTSPHKLRKQVELLERHVEYSACFHRAGRVGDAKAPATWRPGPPEVKAFYTIDDLLRHGHFIPSCTVLVRAYLLRRPAEWMRRTPLPERAYCAMFALAGEIGFLDDEMAVFRSHPASVYARSTNVQHIRGAMRSHRLVGRHLGLRRRRAYREGLARMYRELSDEYVRDGRPIRALAARWTSAWAGRGSTLSGR